MRPNLMVRENKVLQVVLKELIASDANLHHLHILAPFFNVYGMKQEENN